MATIPDMKMATCGELDCENGHHAFNDPSHTYKKKSKDRKFLESGVCKGCGTGGIDWKRLHRRDLSDISLLFSQLPKETIRWRFWNYAFNEAAREHASALGKAGLRREAGERVAKTLTNVATGGWAFQQVPVNETKLVSPVQYAQHAVAACCRKCVATWHGIQNDHPLSQDEISYLTALVIAYLDRRLPEDQLEQHPHSGD